MPQSPEVHLRVSASICGLICFCLAAAPAAAAPITLKDDLGRTVMLERPARRIVTLAPFLTELAFSAGLGSRVVGVSAFSDYPPQARALPQVASAAGVSPERIAALHPDLVLAWSDSLRPEEAERIARLGPAVFVARARRLADVPRLLVDIGTLGGRDTRSLAARYDARLESLRRTYAHRAPLAVFLEIWSRPLTTISGRHFINEALGLCGARNVFADLPGVAPEVSWEELYARDPPVIVGLASAPDAASFRANWRRHPTLSAVRNARLVFAAADALQRPTLRTPEAIAGLCAALDAVRPR